MSEGDKPFACTVPGCGQVSGDKFDTIFLHHNNITRF